MHYLFQCCNNRAVGIWLACFQQNVILPRLTVTQLLLQEGQVGKLQIHMKWPGGATIFMEMGASPLIFDCHRAEEGAIDDGWGPWLVDFSMIAGLGNFALPFVIVVGVGVGIEGI